MKKLLLIVSVCLASAAHTFAKDSKSMETSLYQKGVEEYNNENYDEAYDLFLREIQQNPKNGLAYMFVGAIQSQNQDYASALTSYELGIKYAPKDNPDAKAYCCNGKGSILAYYGDTVKAINSYSLAIKTVPKDADAYINRADLYFYQGKFDLSNADYIKAAEFSDDPYMSYMGLGRNLKEQKYYSDAISWFQKASQLHPELSDPYYFMAQCYLFLNDNSNMAENLVEAMGLDFDERISMLYEIVAERAYNFISAKLQLKLNAEPDSQLWLFYAGMLNQTVGKNRKAIEYYRQLIEKEDESYVRTRIAGCCAVEGDYAQAIYEMEKAIQMDSTDVDYQLTKGTYYDNLFMYDEAERCFSNYIRQNPEAGEAYSLRGWTKWYQGDENGALEDFDVAIDFGVFEAVGFRAMLYEHIGDTVRANADFRNILALDTIPYSDNYREYALLYLEGKDAAVKWLTEKDENNGTTSNYEFACIYSLAGDVDKAAYYLEENLKSSRNIYNHCQRDFDLENLRRSPKFAALMERYRPVPVGNADIDEGLFEERSYNVPMKKYGGVYSVDCKINNLPLSFIFDTGASEVSLSSVEAAFMLKNNYISPSDIIGTSNYQTATGDIYPGTIINLKRVNIGGVEIQNVRASVVKNQSAPLLLGQTVLNRFGKVEIDYQNQMIRITRVVRK